MSGNGWVKLHRKIINSDMYRSLTATQRDVLIQCLLMANHKQAEWIYKKQLQRCSPGQFKTSLEELRKKCARGTTVKQIRGTLDKLSTWQFLTNEGTKTGRIITVLNWNTYQGTCNGEGQTEGQTEGKDRATNNNVKNEKKNIFSPNSTEIRMSELLFNLIRERDPEYKKPNFQKWALHINRMIRLDSRKVDDIEAVITWCQSNEFWQNNILSTSKLREKFGQLKLKMEGGKSDERKFL